MSYDHEADHKALARRDLLAVFRDKPRICALVDALALGVQVMEDHFGSLVADRTFDGCEGAQLDQWGLLVGESRSGLPDREYRAIIRARVLANVCQGDTDSMIRVVQALFPTLQVRHRDAFPAGAWFFAGPANPDKDLPSAQYMARAAAVFHDAEPAGVGLDGVLYREGYFGFADDPAASGYDVGVFADGF